MSSLELARPLPRPTIGSRLRSRGAVRWYGGSLFGLAYQVIEIVNVWTSGLPLSQEIVGTVLLGVFYGAFVVLPPIVWVFDWRVRWAVVAAYWVASFVFWPLIGVDVIWVWPLVGSLIAFCWMPAAPSFILAGVVVVVQFLAAWSVRFVDATGFAPFVTVTVLISLFGITRQIMANQQLRDAQATIASLAVDEERARMARDLHDILGHSLTVVTVKAELAGRLLEQDPAKALTEIRDVERLAREALSDLRSTVSQSREANLARELASARAALAAANIEAHVPVDAELVEPELRPVFGWIVREGVTNVIRHSRARSCWVDLTPDGLTIADDGVGAASNLGRGRTGQKGTGLLGLGERAASVGLSFDVGERPSGGFQLSVGRRVSR